MDKVNMVFSFVFGVMFGTLMTIGYLSYNSNKNIYPIIVGDKITNVCPEYQALESYNLDTGVYTCVGGNGIRWDAKTQRWVRW